MFSKSIVAAALVAGAFANPLQERHDSCGAAVSGSAALGDASIRSSDCASFLATTVTPAAITTTVTVVGTSSGHWDKRAQVTYCPNKVPAYAVGPCGASEEGGAGAAAYSSACSWLGYTADLTKTAAPTTTTKTVYVASTCPTLIQSSTVTITAGPASATGSGYHASTVTVTTTAHGIATVTANSTITVTATANSIATVTANSTVTVTATTNGTAPASTCISEALASSIVADFINFLENTDQGSGFDLALANEVLASDFTDQSDSINFMINTQEGFIAVPLGSVTFDSPEAFDVGQGQEQAPIPSVTTLNMEYNCNTITWRWVASFGYGNNVQGINLMYINSAGQLETDYSEFDNAAWLANYGNPQCAAQIAAASASASNCTTAATTSTTGSAKKRSFNPRAHKRTPNNMLAHY